MTDEASMTGQEEKKGLSTLAWVAIGCGSLVVFGFVVFMALGIFVFNKGKEVIDEATGGMSISDFVEDLQDNPAKVAAETVVRVNPDLELVSTDDDEGTITFRNSQSGEEITLDFEDLAEGRFGVSTEEGDFSFSTAETEDGTGIVMKGPDGEARFGGAANLDEVPDWVPLYPGVSATQNAFHSVSEEEIAGILGGQTADGAAKVIDFFKDRFEAEDWEVTGQSETKTPDGGMSMIVGTQSATERTVSVTAIEASGETQVMVNYSGKTD